MRLWSIAERKWAADISCVGARTYGGRWNPVGLPAFYAATTPELSALEKRVHLSRARLHPPLQLVSLEVPDDPDLFYRPSFQELPPNWADRTNFADAQEFGRRWLMGANQLVLFVPSAVIPEATNAVINPAHPRYQDMRLTIVRDFSFDTRLFH